MKGVRPLVPTNIPQLDGAEPDMSPEPLSTDDLIQDIQLRHKRLEQWVR